MPSGFTHAVANGRILFFFLTENIPCVYIPHLLIHSSTDGCLGSYHVLAVVNKAAMTWGCIYLFQLVFSFSSDKYPGVELLDHVVVLFFIF